MKAGKGKPNEFCKAPSEIKDMILFYTQSQGKLALNEYDGDGVYKFIRKYK